MTLLSEASTPDEHPRYTVPDRGVLISRHFFTNLWVFALTDTEIATFVALSYQRSQYPTRHLASGVFLTEDERENHLRLKRSTWRSTERLHRIGIIDRQPQAGRAFATGKVGDFSVRWQSHAVLPQVFCINDNVIEQPALPVLTRVFTRPDGIDLVRRTVPWEPDELP